MRIEAQDILTATDGGLNILTLLYPHISEYVGTSKKFKLRSDDKTPSANLIKKEDGNWILTDFGGIKGTRASWNGIQWYSHENGISWVEALNELALYFGITGAEIAQVTLKAEFSKRAATPEENEGFGTFELKTSFTDFEIESIFSKNVLKELGWSGGEEKKKEAYNSIASTCKRYNFFSVKHYTWIKNRETLIYSATDKYPMFLIDEGNFKKLYQPFHHDKGRRFMYIGGAEKPKDFIHGLAQAEKEFAVRLKNSTDGDANYDQMDEEEKAESENYRSLVNLSCVLEDRML
ncbi:hypothetical protein [Pedobacter sp. NJ-S-72]